MDKVRNDGIEGLAENNAYLKSNFLIGAKYKSTLLENKILALSLSRSEEFEVMGDSSAAPIVHKIPVSELRRILKANPGSFYTQLDQVAASMSGKTIGMINGNSFDYISVVKKAKCEEGIFSIEYNGELRSILLQLKMNYSRLDLDIMLSFTNNHAFRLYELVKSKCCYRSNETGRENAFQFRVSLSELKLELGVVNPDLDDVRKVLRDQKQPDFELAVERSPEIMFQEFGDFRRKVLDKAVAEINEISDITVEYKPVKKGQGGKVFAIDFQVVSKGGSV